jgi:hypothetical protein
MRKIMNRVFIALMILQLAACSMLSSNPTKSVNLQFKEPNRISFQGKGAGVGIALMGAMGPVGIALGVAIDEGIAKDIREAVSEEKGDSNKFVTRLLTNQIEAQGYSVALNSKQQTVPVITIKRYGFKIMNGSTDATAAEWDVEIELESGKKVKVQYPKDFNKNSIKTYVLADLKKDGKLGAELLTESLSRVLKRL